MFVVPGVTSVYVLASVFFLSGALVGFTVLSAVFAARPGSSSAVVVPRWVLGVPGGLPMGEPAGGGPGEVALSGLFALARVVIHGYFPLVAGLGWAHVRSRSACTDVLSWKTHAGPGHDTRNFRAAHAHPHPRRAVRPRTALDPTWVKRR
jgi:hypothetical protein